MHEIRTVDERGRTWLWPKYDEKLIQVFHQVDDLARILPHVIGRDVCVQAGGACGVWPNALAKEFERVITFEPDPTNYHCLQRNLEQDTLDRVEAHQMALSDGKGHTQLQLHPSEKNNCGAWYLDNFGNGTQVSTIALDDMDLSACDLIQLDVEGFEYEALMGARQTVTEFSPTIVIEEKKLPQFPERMFRARALLQLMGYQEVDRIHRDVIFTK